MTTVVNTPPSNNQGGNGLFFVYGLPMLRQSTQAPQINVPYKVDINVNQTK